MTATLDHRTDAPADLTLRWANRIAQGMAEGVDVPGQVSAVSELLASLAHIDLQGLGSGELLEVLDGLELAGRQVEALSRRALVAAEADGLWATSGARSFAAWYCARTGRQAASARSRVNGARRLRDDLPGTAAALADGRISADHAQVMCRYAVASQATRDQLGEDQCGEAFLLEQATVLDADRFARLVRSWAAATDPDAADRAWREEGDRQAITLAPTLDGYHVQGWLSHESGQVLAEALDARTGVPAADDQRSPAQRRADALIALARLGLDSGTLRPGARIRPHVAVHVPYDTLVRLVAATAPDGQQAIGAGVDREAMAGVEPATLADGTPLAPSQLARLACDSSLHRVIFGPEGEILDCGREERLFTAGQTRAIIARDRHCQYPGCHAPPGEGEIHHSLWWYDHNGRTDARHGVLLCWHHHDVVHRRHLSIERADGGWVFTRPDGSQVPEPRVL